MSQPPHMVALAKASEVKRARNLLKRDVYHRNVTLAEAFERPEARTMSVYDLVRATITLIPRCGQAQTDRVLEEASVALGGFLSPYKSVDDLTDRQKRALLAACGENERSAA